MTPDRITPARWFAIATGTAVAVFALLALVAQIIFGAFA